MRRRLLLLAAASASLLPSPAVAEHAELKVAFITQQTPVWCWAATASMALELLGFHDINPGKNYQCGVVAAAFPQCGDDCSQCITSLGSMDKLVGVLDRYKALSVQDGSKPGKSISPAYVEHPGWDRIKRSLDRSYPVIAGISPDGSPADPAQSQHTVLITGYDDNYRGRGEAWVVLTDPYPYDVGADPYTPSGYSYRSTTGRVRVPWRVLRQDLHLTSAVFLEKRSA